jgi:hypothetical protein
MSKSQKRIVDWALTITGPFMVAGAVINSLPIRWNSETLRLLQKYRIGQSFDFKSFFGELLISPVFYVGVGLVIAGILILKTEK